MEGVRLRVKDIDFERNEIVVREGKGAKDRNAFSIFKLSFFICH